jgi:hypothetical protein
MIRGLPSLASTFWHERTSIVGKIYTQMQMLGLFVNF